MPVLAMVTPSRAKALAENLLSVFWSETDTRVSPRHGSVLTWLMFASGQDLPTGTKKSRPIGGPMLLWFSALVYRDGVPSLFFGRQ